MRGAPRGYARSSGFAAQEADRERARRAGRSDGDAEEQGEEDAMEGDRCREGDEAAPAEGSSLRVSALVHGPKASFYPLKPVATR